MVPELVPVQKSGLTLYEIEDNLAALANTFEVVEEAEAKQLILDEIGQGQTGCGFSAQFWGRPDGDGVADGGQGREARSWIRICAQGPGFGNVSLPQAFASLGFRGFCPVEVAGRAHSGEDGHQGQGQGAKDDGGHLRVGADDVAPHGRPLRRLVVQAAVGCWRIAVHHHARLPRSARRDVACVVGTRTAHAMVRT